MDIHRTSFVWLILVTQIQAQSLQAQSLQAHTVQAHTVQTQSGDEASVQKPIPSIAPGTIVGNPEAARWTRVILLATPRIASGDTTKLSESIRNAVSQLTLTILATVQRHVGSDGTESYRLEEAGVSYSTAIQEKLTTISTETAARLGARLDFYSRQMLSENEKQIASVKVVVRTPTLIMFDAPAIMLRDHQHMDFLTRHLIWIDAHTGKLALVIWLLHTDREGRTVRADKTLRVVAPGTNEDRKIHVDGRSFFLGLPSSRAFALEDLPPGADIAWTEAAKMMAARNTYDGSELNELAASLNQLLHGK